MMPANKIIEITRVSTLHSRQFYRDYLSPKQPVVITGIMQEWSAMQKWSFKFFETLDAKKNKLYTEKGNIMQDKTCFHQSSFSDYIQKLMTDDDKGIGSKEYLSVFNIFGLFPTLQADVDFSLLSEHTYKDYVYAWIGPKGTLTGYHIDWADNILAQIQGRKHLYLVSPQQSKWMYPSKKYDYRTTISEIEPEYYDAEKHPLYEQVQVMETLLHPGEMLYIPRGWWHRVKSLDKSISVNSFGQNLIGMAYQFRADLLDQLHKVGLYRSNCTCHMMLNNKRVAK